MLSNPKVTVGYLFTMIHQQRQRLELHLNILLSLSNKKNGLQVDLTTERHLMKQRKTAAALALVLALSAGVIYLHSLTLEDHLLEEIAAQKEAEEKKASFARLWAFGKH